ncbi:MAG TPA: FAD-dependent monooxygenase [Streptomyces sp.]|nr:FAD-dependent monooxygenase [Streptomyces sp.]
MDELRENVIAIAGTGFALRDPVWLSRYGDATRLATRYRSARVFLAGDAAHHHFPAGGVGMNAGIQDAANLAWKLAAHLNGWAPDTHLDTYHTGRHPVGADLTRTSRAQVALMTAFTPQGLSPRALFGRLITALRPQRPARRAGRRPRRHPPRLTGERAAPARRPLPVRAAAVLLVRRGERGKRSACRGHRRRRAGTFRPAAG